MESKIFEIFAYTIPSIITGGVAYYFFYFNNKNEKNRRTYLLKKEVQKDILSIRLLAYERMILFVERINPLKLLIRIKPISEDKMLYENLIYEQIEQEFEHNLTQQIYLSQQCWFVIVSAKNATIHMIRNTNKKAEIENANQLREFIFTELMNKESPSNVALLYIKKEVHQFLRY